MPVLVLMWILKWKTPVYIETDLSINSLASFSIVA